jgi:hypothetical protein
MATKNNSEAHPFAEVILSDSDAAPARRTVMTANIVRAASAADLRRLDSSLEALRRGIAQAETAHEYLQLANGAEALLGWLKLAGALVKDQNRVARMKVDAERKAGELLAASPKATPGRLPKNRTHGESDFNGGGPRTYAEMAAEIGWTPKQFKNAALRSQLIHAVPPKDYAREMAALETKGRLITSAYFIALGQKLKHAAKRRQLAASVPLDPGIRHGDFRQVLADVPDNSVSLIFTDPPYDKGSLPLYGDLARLAARVLTDGGSLVCYAPQYALLAVGPLMTPHLRYQWEFCVRHSGGHRRQHGWRVRVSWKPLLWFVKGHYRGDYVQDHLDSAPGDKSRHDWAQGHAEAAYLIEKLCPEAGMVLDPLCGSGTTLLAAKRLGRRWLGAEIDRERAGVASGLLAEAAAPEA